MITFDAAVDLLVSCLIIQLFAQEVYFPICFIFSGLVFLNKLTSASSLEFRKLQN